jgi:hypothetical protein
MNLVIDSKILNKNSLNIGEFLLLMYYKKSKILIEESIKSLFDKNLLCKDLFLGETSLTPQAKQLVDKIIINSSKNIKQDDAYYEDLAKNLREIYPAGKKPGTVFMWRGNTAEIVKKLKTLAVKYNIEIDRDKIIKKTKEYVASFNGNYDYMPLLKYFILKTVKDADDNTVIKSELMNLLENEDYSPTNSNSDWTGTLI